MIFQTLILSLYRYFNMKNLLKIIPVLIFILSGTGCASSDNPNDGATDSVKPKTAADTLPHEVRHGKVASYAYIPDTSVQKIILGNTASFSKFYHDHGANMNNIGNDRIAVAYFNLNKTEELQLLLTKNAKGENVPYSITLQKYGDAGSPLLTQRPFTTEENNFVSGNGIYIGMNPDYVMAVYTDQAMMQSEHNDTLVLKYNPLKKDARYYSNYSMNSYSTTYKFVNDRLVRMEYAVDPKEFEGK
jgi:hypothetical protein